MLANLFLGDFAVRLNGGIKPQSLATGTTSGSAVPLTNPANKIAFRLLAELGTASATVSLYLQTATASNGTFASLSQTLSSMIVSAANSRYELCLDTRDEAFCNLGTGATWVQPVVVVATTATPVCLDVLGYDSAREPGSNFNGSTNSVTTALFAS